MHTKMKRVLAPAERSNYRGVTLSASTGLKFDKLFSINTAKELISAELYGRQAVPSEDPENCHLFSNGRGNMTKYN